MIALSRIVTLALDLLTAEDRRAEILRIKAARARRLCADAARHAQEAEQELHSHIQRAAADDAVEARARAEAIRAMAEYEDRAKVDMAGGWM